MADMETPHLEKKYRIFVYDTGPDERVNLCSLFDYMQDIAAEHAIKLGYGRDELVKRNHFWVLSRMYAVISDWPFRGDTVIVKTWPAGTDGIFALRYYEISFPDGKNIATASSSWLIVDRTTKKIQRPDEQLTRYNSDSLHSNATVRTAMKLAETSEKGQQSGLFRVKISDLDANLHTNNVNYLKWVNDSYDLDFVMNHIPASAEINYLAESKFGEEIMIRTSKEEESRISFRHSVVRKDDNRELCRIRLEWNEVSIKKV
jgi:medium-chain acyl-[acyl-carrier-protein] hydrolase